MRTMVAAAVAALVAHAASAEVTMEMIANDDAITNQVVTNGMGRDLQRFSPLDQINAGNVKSLVPAWAFSFGGEKQRGQESQPIVYDGVMYVTASYSRLYAVDVATGEELWQYDARLPEGILPCCDVINRGAAIYGDTIFFGTLDAKLVALDRSTGKVLWRKRIGDYKAGYSFTAAPMIVDSSHGPLVITGNSGGEFGILGAVEARNVETGETVWRRPVIEGHVGELMGEPSTMTGELNASWPGDMWKNGGGATWLGGSYDARTNSILYGTGNPAPWNSWLRGAGAPEGSEGDNLYAASRIALDPDTGEIKAHYQTTPREGWDFDGVNEVVPFEGPGGEALLATADRNGFFYTLDAQTLKPVVAEPFVEGVTWASSIDLETGRPNYIEDNRPGDPAAATDGVKGEVTFSVPGFLGGKNWMPMAYSQRTGLFYVPANEWGMDLWNEPVTYKKGAAYMGAGFTIKPLFESHIGALKAVDPMTGDIKWAIPNNAPLWGGVMTTAGGLVFYGTPEGHIKAVHDETGEELWSFQTGSGVVGQPITWDQDGVQMLAIVSGWGGAVPLWGGEVAARVKHLNQGGTVWVFRLADVAAQLQ